MSKTTVSVLLSAAVSGAIAGGAVAMYGRLNQLQVSLSLSGSQASVLATVLGALSMILGYYVLRKSPEFDKQAMSAELSVLVVLAGLMTLGLAGASFSAMKLAGSVSQMWLLPAVITAIVGAFLGVLTFGYGLVSFGERVPDRSTASDR